jgi:hypothetical protein
MQIIDIAQFEDGFVIHLATEDRRINAYTLASMLIGLADAAKAANSTINAGHNIEIVVEALGPGSFRARIRAIYDTAHNLFSNQAVQVIILGIITNFIYERTLAVHQDVRVEIQTDEVVVEHGNERIVIPRKVYDGTRLAETNPQFVGAIGRTMESLSNDQHITGMAFVPHMDSPPPDHVIPKDAFSQIVPSVRDEGNTRVIEENCDLQIVKAILERNHRKWEFRWRGVKISAPVLDQQFYTEFFAHNIRIAPGDELKVNLLIRQTKDEETGIYANVGYEVVRVFEHIPRVQQTQLTQVTTH